MEFKKGQEWECIVNNREARIGDVGRWVSDKIFHLNDEYYTINELFDFNKYFRLLDPMIYGVEIESKMNNEVFGITTDKVVQSVMNDLNERSKVGINKYGVTLERTDLSLKDWLQHSYEETLDKANYLKRAILELEK